MRDRSRDSVKEDTPMPTKPLTTIYINPQSSQQLRDVANVTLPDVLQRSSSSACSAGTMRQM